MDTDPLDIHALPGHLIRRLHQISVAQFMERMAAEGIDLTPVQFSAMAAIRRHPGIDQASVAGLIAYDRATLGKVVDRLVDKGLVARRVSAADRRAREVSLTRDGEALLERILPVVRAAQPAIFTGLTAAEQETFVALLRKATLAANELSRAPQRDLPSSQAAE
ncbi:MULTISPECIES: MarR family winged helix-turn-helix transcriptional regulator [Leisingera]|jgi:DNA-binding MarR family transcriptional regulator|uniref:MarR family winged helix-turn-helix transcriptional regulator n=1 Tax=Leisingera TaxID=191028 RepID=UPI000411073F|nr:MULTISPECIES: MarR family transcriptional regulator [Leisingera]QDI76147.1 MarR family transcriptional regulator [Leisingera aquaemixtae]